MPSSPAAGAIVTRSTRHHGAARDAIVTPMQGTVLAVEVAEGDEVEAGQVVCVVEAMKMENEITSPRAGIVSELSVWPGQAVTHGPGHLPRHAGRRLTERRPFCADLSRENDEPLAATASRIDNWFLIEYRGLWTREALPGSGLSDQVKQHLRDQVARGPARPSPLRPPARSTRPAGARRFHGFLATGRARP